MGIVLNPVWCILFEKGAIVNYTSLIQEALHKTRLILGPCISLYSMHFFSFDAPHTPHPSINMISVTSW